MDGQTTVFRINVGLLARNYEVIKLVVSLLRYLTSGHNKIRSCRKWPDFDEGDSPLLVQDFINPGRVE